MLKIYLFALEGYVIQLKLISYETSKHIFSVASQVTIISINVYDILHFLAHKQIHTQLQAVRLQ